MRTAAGQVLRQAPPEVAPRWLDSWAGRGVIVEAMERRGWDVSLTRYAEGWRGAFIRRDYQARAWVDQVLTFHQTPWRAVQHAAWSAVARGAGCCVTRPRGGKLVHSRVRRGAKKVRSLPQGKIF